MVWQPLSTCSFDKNPKFLAIYHLAVLSVQPSAYRCQMSPSLSPLSALLPPVCAVPLLTWLKTLDLSPIFFLYMLCANPPSFPPVALCSHVLRFILASLFFFFSSFSSPLNLIRTDNFLKLRKKIDFRERRGRSELGGGWSRSLNFFVYFCSSLLAWSLLTGN
jgi:hypothetical protein